MWECARGPLLLSTSSLYTSTENKPLKSHYNVSGAEALIPWRQECIHYFHEVLKRLGHTTCWWLEATFIWRSNFWRVLGWVIGHPILQSSGWSRRAESGGHQFWRYVGVQLWHREDIFTRREDGGNSETNWFYLVLEMYSITWWDVHLCQKPVLVITRI